MNKKYNGHYIRKNYTSALPHRLLFLDTETKLISDVKTGLQTFRLGAACHVVNESKDFINYREQWYNLTTLQAVYDMFDHLAYADTVLHVYGSNICFDITACRLVQFLAKNGWELVAYREKGLTFILIVKKGKRKIKFLAMQNFIPTSIKKLGDLIGIEKQEIDYNTENTELLMKYCMNDVLILKNGIMAWYQFVLSNNLGGHAITLPSQSFRAFRHRFMKQKILVHCDDNLAEYERVAYHGGRCEAFRIGKQSKQDYVQLDVNSMYPYVMSKYEYPTALLGYIQKENMNQLKQTLKNHCVIALVLVETEKPVYLGGIVDRACFPIGRYWLLLTTRELIYGFNNNIIKNVWSGVYYKKRQLFGDYMKFFYDLRMKYESENNEVYRKICKLFMNSLYGKFGERYDKVINDFHTDSDEMRIEEWVNAETGERGTETTMLHRCIQTAGKDEGKNSVVSIACHVTADARMLLWHYIEKIGLENVLYTDTDSIICTKNIMEEKISNHIGDKLGQLKIEMESNDLEINGAKDYRFGSKRILKGVQRIETTNGQETYHSLHSLGLSTLIRQGIDAGAVLRPVKLKLSGNYNKGIIAYGGQVSPFRLSEEVCRPADELYHLSLHERY